jgi:hypothetical protein
MNKKLSFLIFLFVLLFASISHAAWDIDVSVEANVNGKNVFKIALTGDGTALSQNIGAFVKCKVVY